MQQKRWLKDFEHHISSQTWNAAEALLQAGAVKNLREVEKHFWVALVATDEGHFETEMIISPHKIKAFTCECFGEGRRLMCAHVAASLLRLRQFLEQRQEEKRAKAEQQEQKERSRLTVQDALQNATPDAITEFVLEYARRDRDFALALKTWFAGLVTASENPYLLVLDSVIPKGKNVREPEFRRLRKTLDDLGMQADAALALSNFQTVFLINTAILRKIGAFLPQQSDNRYTLLLQAWQVALHQLLNWKKEEVAQALRDHVWDFLFELGSAGHIPSECSREALQYLADAAKDAAKFEQINRLFDETPAPAPPFVLHLFLVALADRGSAEAVARVLEDYSGHPERVRTALLVLYYLKYKDAVTLAGEAFLQTPDLPTGWRKEMEDILLFLAEQSGDTARQREILQRRFLQSGSFEQYEKLKKVAAADWPALRRELADMLQAKGERAKLASMLALDNDWEALVAWLDEEPDIRQVQRFEAQLLPEYSDFLKNRYVTLLHQYLLDHFGQPAAAYARQQLSVLLQKGATNVVKEIAQELIAQFPDRPSLPEELAELFPKTRKRVLL
ncbi:MAG: hypothetical protein JNM22_04475 [Saprospiraceae bacterium]|nr:hypothetical protein [Saprospiraceae bacterium]